jgi:pilus assembly protein Flp/PilA
METKVNKEEQNEIKQDRERGASLVEYGILVALIAAFAIGAVTMVGTQVDRILRGVGDDLENVP